jgi:mono/diheme cytochrome c family protein
MIRTFILGCAVSALIMLGATSLHAGDSLLERGAYLMNGIVTCGNCHNTRGPDGRFIKGMELAGGMVIADEVFTVMVPNITPDMATGIGVWSGAEIITAIREGTQPDRSLIAPPMPFSQYRSMSDSDIKAIVAYLRQVPAISHKVGKSEYRMPLPPAWGPPVGTVADVSTADFVTYGGYLAGPLGHCIECHTPMENGRLDIDNKAFSGGLKLPVGLKMVLTTANITQDKETGIGAWSDAEIVAALTRGARPDGAQLHPIMPYGFYASMTEADMNALVAFLRTVKLVTNAVR